MPEFKIWKMGRAGSVRREAGLARQLGLDLREKREKATHGGARAGAGRPRKKDSERGFIAHRTRPSHRKDDPVHVTLRVNRQLPSLRHQVLERIVKRHLRRQRTALETKGTKHFQLVHFSIQADHLHLIVEAADKRGLARGMVGLEVRIARALNAQLGRSGAVFVERYHRRDLRTPTEVRNVLRYVLLNTQKHSRVIGDRNFADPFSSAASFDGFTGPVYVFDDAVPWPRVTPRSWLLRVGWRRRGLIDPADLPASPPPHR